MHADDKSGLSAASELGIFSPLTTLVVHHYHRGVTMLLCGNWEKLQMSFGAAAIILSQMEPSTRKSSPNNSCIRLICTHSSINVLDTHRQLICGNLCSLTKMDMLFKTVQISEISGASSKVVKLKEPPKRRWPQNPQSTRNPSIRQRTIKVGSLFPASSAAHIVHNQMPLPGSRRFSSFCHSIQVAHDCFYSINATKST